MVNRIYFFRIIYSVLVVAMLLTACSSPEPTPSATLANLPTLTFTFTVTSTATSTPKPTQTLTQTPKPTQTPTPTTLPTLTHTPSPFASESVMISPEPTKPVQLSVLNNSSKTVKIELVSSTGNGVYYLLTIPPRSMRPFSVLTGTYNRRTVTCNIETTDQLTIDKNLRLTFPACK